MARFSCGMLHSSRLVDTRFRWSGKEDAARVSRYPLLVLARECCLPRPVRSKRRVHFHQLSSGQTVLAVWAGFSLARKTTAGVVFRFGRDNSPRVERRPKRERPIQQAGKIVAESERRARETRKERDTSVRTKRKRSQRQHVSRAPQPDCALINDRMFISRRSKNRVVAALQPIANHIHRPADYPVDTPVSRTGLTKNAVMPTRKLSGC